jgi:uncharacterized protein (TIGR03546 family)
MFLFRPLRLFARALTVDSTPRQMALGLAFGVVAGLVPKGNLLAIGLMMLLCSLRINLGIGLAAVFVASWVGILLDPISHRVGAFLLRHPALQHVWTAASDTILLPWTDFNNTVVLGSFVLGVGLFVPIYLVSLPFFSLFTPRLVAWVRRFRLVTILWGGELTGKVV